MFSFYNTHGLLKSNLNFLNDEIDGGGFFYNDKNVIEYKIKFKESSPLDWANLSKNQFAFSLSFPKDWHLAFSDNKLGRISLINKNSLDNYKPNVNVVTILNEDNLSLSSVINQNIEEFSKSYKDFKILNKKDNIIVYEIF